uniref:Piezo type mechanosensitive ion channel component 2 n=1 Tax=Labrus bergylta TaxID=56723 RepID=A0A3Q3FEP5_9LABR
MFVAGLAIWLLCRSLVQKRPPEDMAQYNTDFDAEEQVGFICGDMYRLVCLSICLSVCLMRRREEEEAKESTKMKVLRHVAQVASKMKEVIGNLISTAGQVVVTILLGMTGIMLPSLTSAVYFFIFLFLCTWWSLRRTFDTLIFSCMCVLMAIFSAGHLIVLYLYQFQFFQESISPDDSYISVFGISPIVQSNCSYTWKLIVHPQRKWYHFVNPIMLLLLYYTLATLIRLWLQEPIDLLTVRTDDKDEDMCEEEDLDGNRTNNCANRKRQLWWESRQGTDEKNVRFTLNHLSASLNFRIPMSPITNSELFFCVQPEKKDECVYEVCLPLEDSALEGGEEKSEDTEDGIKKRGVGAMVKIFHFIMKQSYICALIAMMAWSITYVSWLTFVFLIWSCMLWMVRDRRRYAMLSSPFMVAYGNLLIVLQYIWTFENMKSVSGLFVKKNNPFHSLSSKVLCLLSFWLLLRQTLTERQEKQKEDSAGLSDVYVVDQEKKGEQDTMHVLGSMVMALLVKYWIYICGGMFFLVSFEGTIVMYKIIYMMMFLSCVTLYQVHFEWWRRILKYFWMSVVMYTMLVLTLVYTYQFETSPDFWSNMTNMDTKSLEDLGLKTFSVSELFTRIFIPTSFLLVCILHLHYFHDRFLQLTDLQAVVAKEESTIYRLAHPDGSLADLTMLSVSSVEATLPREELEQQEKHEELREKEERGEWGTEQEKDQALVVVLLCLVLISSSDLKNKWHLVVDRLTVLFLKFLEYFHKLQLFIWWLLEIHIIKIVSCYIVMVSVEEVSLLNYVFLVSWAFALPYSQYRPLASSVCTVWTCVIIVCKMLYQLKSIKPPTYSQNCTASMPSGYSQQQMEELKKNSLLYKELVEPAHWVGLEKQDDLLGYLRNNLLMLALLAFEVTIYRHQEYFRLRNKLSPPAARIIFHDITRQHLDLGIISFIKYFINYFFYKFGLETCLLLVVNVIGQRMDFYGMLHAFALIAVMHKRRRKAIAEIWPKYCCFLACMMTVQYFVCIGIPPAACKDYPWRFPNSSTDSNVVKWLYVPDFLTRPKPTFLIYDFMLLLCASMQRQVFDDENKAAVRIMAGDNVEICRDLDAASFSVHNPVPDFIHCRSYLDMLKVIMFSYLFCIFCMGYLVACFYFLLFGGDLLLKPIKKILHYWDFLIAYNVFVITMKNILSILACGYINVLIVNNCWLIQLLSLACTIKDYKINIKEAEDQCDLPRNEAGIIWDSICFAFLLLQRRVFMSYYFLHVVADIRASQILASRGAELFQATIVKAVRARLEEERKSVEQLKRQMERIKVRQQKFKRGKEKMLSIAQESGEGQTLVQPEEDDDDGMMKAAKASLCGAIVRKLNFTFCLSVVRSGDYYLFETDSEEEEEEEEKKEDEPPKKSAFQFLYHAWITDPKAALRARGKEKRKFWKKYTKGVRRRKSKKEAGHVTVDLGELSDGGEKEEENKKTDNIIKRVFNIIKFTWVLFQTAVESFTRWMNDMCREYIDISTVLRIERCMLTREVKKVPRIWKNLYDTVSHLILLITDDLICHSHQPLSALTEATTLFSRQSTLEDLDGMPECIPKTSERARPKLRKMYGLDVSNSSVDSCSSFVSRCLASASPIHTPIIKYVYMHKYNYFTKCCIWNTTLFYKQNMMFYDEELDSSDRFYQKQPLILQLGYALYNMLVAHSEMVCYLVIIINHMVSASCATLVLPITIFLWAMLSVPRPSKRYWMTAIIYTEVTIFIKYFCQFGFFPFNQNKVDKNKPYHPPNIIGVEKKDGYVHFDLVQLLALFFHRSILKVTANRQTPTALTYRSHLSSAGSHTYTGTGSVASVHLKTRKQMIMEKLREQLFKGKAFVLKRFLELYLPMRQFFYNLIHPEYSAVTDVYVLMFLADTVDFIIIVFGFWAFGKHSAADITSSLSEDQVPGPFLVMVLIQFGTMVVDRALYLRKSVMGKVIFQVFLLFGIHFWMFFILPGVTEKRFSENRVAQMWYFVKCIYFALSAYQIRCGYPTRVLGNFLTKSYNYMNLFLFQGFRLVPFLTELRAVMDWVWTDTSLSLSSWICVEDIYAHIFILKCWRESEKRYPQPRGQKKKKVVKYGMGGMIVALLICIVWFPLLFMSLVKSVAGVVNPPMDVSFEITLAGFQPIFTMSAQQKQLHSVTPQQFRDFVDKYKKHAWLEGYVSDDLIIAELKGSSNSLWTISPPSRYSLIEMLNISEAFSITVSWSVQRNLTFGAKAETASGKRVTFLDNSTRENLISLLIGKAVNGSMIIEDIFPRYIRAPSDSEAKPVDLLNKGEPADGGKIFNINLTLMQTKNIKGAVQEWWKVNQTEAGHINYSEGKKDGEGLDVYVFSDQVSPPSLGFLAGYGIMGLYASVVLVIGKFVREFFSGISHTIMFEELPNVDRILKLCMDIFLVRETGELDLEEDMYAKLIFLYRSPETMIKWTREKTE